MTNEFGYEIELLADGKELGAVAATSTRDFTLGAGGPYDVSFSGFDEDSGGWLPAIQVGQFDVRAGGTTIVTVTWKK